MIKFLTLCFVFVTLSAGAQQKLLASDNKETLEKVCDTVMSTFSTGQFRAALELLLQHSVIEQEKLEGLLNTVENQSINAFPSYGKMLSAEFIFNRSIKDIIVKRYYLLKFEKTVLRFDFLLYKTPQGWKINSFNYSDNLLELLN